MTDIARAIAEYLQNSGLGTLNTDIFLDVSPDTPSDIITIYDKGGNTPEKPENWRKLYVEVRSAARQTSFERVWNIFNSLIYPQFPLSGYIRVGTDTYLAEFQTIPAIDDSNIQNNVFGFKVVIWKVVLGSSVDDWLQALAQWTESILPGWTVYRALSGNQRPSVTWQITGVKVENITKEAFKMTKVFTGKVQGNTQEQLMFGTTHVVGELGNAAKLLLDSADNRYLTIYNPVADLKVGALTTGQISVTLSRMVSNPVEELPLMASVYAARNE